MSLTLIRSGYHTLDCEWGSSMRVFDRYWLDYDSVAFVVFMVALSLVELLVLGI